MSDDLQAFYADLQNTVRAAAASDGIFTQSAFVEEMSKRMSGVEEIDALLACHFEGSGANNKKLELDGYDFGDEAGHVVLAIADHHAGDEIATITDSEARRKFRLLEAFVDASFDGSFSNYLEESSQAYQVAADLRDRQATIFKIRLYLITNAKLSARTRSFESVEIGGITIEYHLWDVERFRRVEASQLGREEIDIDLTEWSPGGVQCLRAKFESADLETYLAVLPGSLLAGVYQKYGGRVLEANVRSFLSVRGNVNKGIRGTVLQQPERFLAYNNGITATATEVSTRSENGSLWLTSLKDLQIVNGGQTTASLFYVKKDDPAADLTDVHVQMKLIVVQDTETAEIVPKISRFANTQNRVSEADFFSNHPFHVRMEEKSRRLLAPAQAGTHFQTKWFYERTRGQYANEKSKLKVAEARRFETENPKAQVVTKTDAARFISTWSQRPHVVSSGAQKNFLAFADEISKTWGIDGAIFGDEYYRGLVAKGILFNSVRSMVQKSDWYSSGYLANVVTYALAKLSSMIETSGRGGDLDFPAIWAAQRVPEPLLREIEPIAKSVFDVLTDDARPIANVTEWAKREKCWDEVKAVRLPLSPALSKFVLISEDRRDIVRDTKKEQRMDTGIDAQVNVMKLGSKYWVNLRFFGTQMKSLSPKDKGILAYATGESGKLPTELQARALMRISASMEALGFNGG